MTLVKTDVLADQLGKKGLTGLLAIFATCILFLYYKNDKAWQDRFNDKVKESKELKIEIVELKTINIKKDTIIVNTLKSLGAKEALEALKK